MLEGLCLHYINKIQRPVHRKFCRSLCFHLWVVNSVGSNSHFFGRCKSYYLKGWLKWCHEPVWPAVSDRPARKALRQLTVLVVRLLCLFSLRLISHGCPENCWREENKLKRRRKNTGNECMKILFLFLPSECCIHLWIGHQRSPSPCFAQGKLLTGPNDLEL